MRAQARSEAGQHEAAQADLAALFRMAECMGTPLQRHYCLLMAARLAENRGDRDAALVALRDGLALAADAPLCYFLVWRPATLAHLMALALENDIEPEAAHKIIRERKLAPPRPLRPLDPWPRRYRVRMLGDFSLTRDGVCVARAQSAKLALLQSLIWHGGRNVSIGKIVDDVWPEKDGDRAENTLQVTLLRLRELLGEKNAISVVNRTISLDPSLWGPDLEEFRSLIALLQEELAQARSCDKKSRITFLQDRLLAVYGGDLLVDAGDALEPES